MAAMDIPKTLFSWVLLLHKDADTSLLLNFITKPILLTFSIRQGDIISMVLFLLYVEPLLLQLQQVFPWFLFQARGLRSLESPFFSFQDSQESYVDDVDRICTSDEDFIRIDQCVGRFEKISGAILNWTEKSVVLGLGAWKSRKHWPLGWLKTVTKMKAFGFFLHCDNAYLMGKNLVLAAYQIHCNATFLVFKNNGHNSSKS